MENQAKRLNFIDIAKGIGIILVVLGHSLAYECHNRLFFMIYSFHMPLFFFLSGFVFKSKDSASYFSGKVKTLLVPLVCFQALNIFTYDILLFLGLEEHHGIIAFGGFWFLGTLLFVSCLYYILSEKVFSNFKHSNIVILLSAALTMTFGLIYAQGISDQSNQIIATSFVAYSFYAVGHICSTPQKLMSLVLSNSKIFRLLATIIGLLLFALLAYLVGFTDRNVDMNTSRYGDSFFFILNALVGIFATMFICIGFFKNRILEFFGKNSLMIFLIHIPLWRFFFFVCEKNLNLHSKFGLSICVFAICITLSSIFAELIGKYFPWLTGKIKFNK